MDIIENRILGIVPYVYRTVARLERNGTLAKLSVIVPLLLLILNVVMYVHITELEARRLNKAPVKLVDSDSNFERGTPYSYSSTENEKVSACEAHDEDLNCIDGENDLEGKERGIFGGETRGNLYKQYASLSDETEQEDFYEDDIYVDEEDGVTSDYLNAIETPREMHLYGDFIGSQPLLKPGAILANMDNHVSPQQHTLIVLTSHGESKKSIGYVVNVKLNEEESERARNMLRESTDEYAPTDTVEQEKEPASSSSSIDEEDLVYQERFPKVRSKLRSEKVRGLINPNNGNEMKLWLGVGGTARDASESWAHIHTCTDTDDRQILNAQVGLAIGGDIVQVLQGFHQNRCRLKILYGFTAWAPGELDSEVHENRWRILEKVDIDILFDASLNQTQVWLQGILSMGESES